MSVSSHSGSPRTPLSVNTPLDEDSPIRTPDFARSPIRTTPSVDVSQLKRRVHASRNPHGRPISDAAMEASVKRRDRSQRQRANMSDEDRELYLARKRFAAQKCRERKKLLQGERMAPSNQNAPREGADVRAARIDLFSSVTEKIANILIQLTLGTIFLNFRRKKITYLGTGLQVNMISAIHFPWMDMYLEEMTFYTH